MGDKCSSCGANITWAETNGGKSIPVDRHPSLDGGNVVLGPPADPRDPPVAILISKKRPREPGELAHLSHFATCPDAVAWRKQG